MIHEKPILNEVLARWLNPSPDLAPGSLDCVACTRALENAANASRWRDFKCCAFQPFVANFLCGAMLEAGMALPSGVKHFSFQPLGLIPSAEFRKHCLETPDEKRDATHLCAFYDRGARACSAWKFRPGECSFYFCSADSGRAARAEWSEKSFRLETGLAQLALVDLGFSSREIAAQVDELNQPSAASISQAEAEKIYRATWAFAKKQSRLDIDSWLADE